MSLFDDVANALGHTADTLAQDLGMAVSDLQGVVNELSGSGIDVFSAASRLGLSPIGFLRGIIEIMHGDPHQVLLHHLTNPARPTEALVNEIAGQWTQLVMHHQDTVQQIHAHFTNLFQGADSSYSSPAASTLWNTHQGYQQYFGLLIDHAQTQQSRYSALGGQYGDYVNQVPEKVYSLSTPMAALGVLSFETANAAPPAPPPSVWDNPVVDVEVAAETDVAVAGLAGLPEDAPALPLWAIILIIIAVIIVITVIVVLIIDAVQSHQNQQHSTTTPTPNPTPTPLVSPTLTPTQKQHVNDIISWATSQGYSINQPEIEALVRAGYTVDAIKKMIAGGDLHRSVGRVYTSPGGHPYTAHTSKHIGVPDADLKDWASKTNRNGGAAFATSFPDQATAQAAVDFAIAHNTALQHFILAATPNTDIQEKVCDVSKDFGYGYQRNSLPNGTVGPPTALSHLRCVIVWLGVDADGNVFVIDAYPSVGP